jgi:ABC-2 type transport system permease protein
MWSLLQIELYKISKRPRTYIAFASIAAIIFIFHGAFKADGSSYLNMLLQTAGDTFDVDRLKIINGNFMCYLILNTLLLQIPILVALIAGDAISGEANMGTLRLLLTKPISRSRIIGIKFIASVIYTMALLIFMALLGLFMSKLIFGVDDMLIFRVNGESSEIAQITKDDILWRYFCAFGYATVALTVIAALALLLSVFAENSIGPIITTVCIVIVCTIISNMNVPIIDRTIKPFLFTSYLVGWKGFFYIAVDEENIPIKGSIEDWPAIRNSLYILLLHIGIFFGASVFFFRRKDVMS